MLIGEQCSSLWDDFPKRNVVGSFQNSPRLIIRVICYYPENTFALARKKKALQGRPATATGSNTLHLEQGGMRWGGEKNE